MRAEGRARDREAGTPRSSKQNNQETRLPNRLDYTVQMIGLAEHNKQSKHSIRHIRGRGRKPTRQWALVIARLPREGHVQRAVRRCFIAGNGRPRSSADFLRWAFPKLGRYQGWHRWSVKRALLKYAVPIGRGSSQGCPVIWQPRTQHGRNIRNNTT
jgi:hypothetical protein